MMWTVHNLDVFDAIGRLDDESVHLLLTDPPYFKVKDEPWDHAWDSPGGFLEWMGDWLAAVRPKLSKRGTVAVFTSPLMFGRVEAKVAQTFSVFGNVVWAKPVESSTIRRNNPGDMRAPAHISERIVFSEHPENTTEWANTTDGARISVYEPIRAYLDSERERAGVTVRQVAEAYQQKTGSRTVTGMAGHWFGRSQWALPTEDNYEWLRSTLSRLNGRGEYLRRDYEYLRRDYEYLRRDYEDLRRDYEHLRRRWNSGPQGWQLLSDVWTFPTVRNGPGRHVCEKPTTMLRHIVELTTDPDDLVVDLFAGSGSTGEAALSLGRRFVGNDAAAKWAAETAERCRWAAGEATPPDFTPVAVTGEPQQLRLA